MDESTKLSASRLLQLLSLLKKDQSATPQDADALFDRHLTAAQKQAAQQLLNDPQRLQELLQRPQVQTLLQKLQQKANDHGADV